MQVERMQWIPRGGEHAGNTLPAALKRLAALVVCLVVAGCGGESPSSPSPTATVSYASELQLCIDQTNQYRASVSRPALARSSALETYADAAARNDGTAHVGHQHFTRTNGGGVAFAENEIPWWPLNTLGSVRAVVEQGLAGMWAEGRGGGHHENMRGPYTEIGCGVFVNGNEVTVVQAFR